MVEAFFSRVECGSAALNHTRESDLTHSHPGWVVPVLIGVFAAVLLIAIRSKTRTPPSQRACGLDSFDLAATRWCTATSDRGARLLFAYRFVCLCWSAFVLARQLYVCAPLQMQQLFFTVWNYELQAVFWLLASVASASYVCRAGKGRRPCASAATKVVRRLAHVVFEVSLPISWLVSIVQVRDHGLRRAADETRAEAERLRAQLAEAKRAGDTQALAAAAAASQGELAVQVCNHHVTT